MNPLGLRLPQGSRIDNVRLGFRRWMTLFEMIYVQHENHRYFAKVVNVRRETHTTRHGRRVTRTIIDVETRTP
jgi:hypothetical protein